MRLASKVMLGLTLAFVVVAAALFFAFPAHAHDESVNETPASADPRAEEVSMVCYQLSARQAWGALSRFYGSPQRIVLVPREELRAAFYAEAPRYDGILLADDMEEQQQADMTEMLFFGWMVTDKAWADGREIPPYSALLSIFYSFCKDSAK